MAVWNSQETKTTNPLYLASLLFLPLTLLLFIRKKRSTSNSNNLPPSPPRLPVIGNLHQLGSELHRSLRALSLKHGPLMLMHLGQTPTLVVSSSEIVKEIVKNHDIEFSDRPQTTATEIFFYGCRDIGFSPYGEYWRQARKICVLELLSLKRVQEFQSVRDEEIGLLIDGARKACRGGDCINLSEMLIRTSNNIASRCILGRRFEEGNRRSVFGDLSRKLMEQMVAFCVGDFFPSFKWVDVARGFVPGLKVIAGEFDKFFDQVIEEHRSKSGVDNDGSDGKDFVDILLGLQKSGLLDFELTLDNIKAIITDMFVGGSDTTSTANEWLVAELIRNPRVMKKAQEEVRRVVGNKRKIEMDDINKMNYLKCVIKENLRLHPPLPLLVARKTSATTKVGGYDVPANTTIFINAWAIHRSPGSWDRPEEFVPERFEDGSVDFKGHDFHFIPFGSGRRGCPGSTFGIASIEHVIANLLYWFDWKLSGGMLPEDLDMSEVYGLTVTKKVPLNLIPISYNP